MNRREARQAALQVLFQMTVSGTDKQTAVDAVSDNGTVPDSFAQMLVQRTLDNRQRIDQTISGSLKNWKIGRIGNIDRAILRLAVCEMLYFKDIPNSVSINEAVELCKIYSDDQSRIFVNGVLSGIAAEHGQQGVK
ncbi:MAG: transcription antitermination factor NusB [Sporolactobacillus sp.]